LRRFATIPLLLVASCSSPTNINITLADGASYKSTSAARFGGSGGSRILGPNLEYSEYTSNEVSLRDGLAGIPGAWGAVANTIFSPTAKSMRAEAALLQARGMGIKIDE
jgi:hypothetical protein